MSKWIGSIRSANEKIARLHKSTARAREKAGELMENVVHTTEQVGTSALFGYLEGRLPDSELHRFEIVKGVPLPLAVGFGAKLFSILGVGRGMESHLNSVSNGALCAHFNGVGRNLGKRQRMQDDNASAYPVRGLPPRGAEATEMRGAQGYGVSPADLARMVA